MSLSCWSCRHSVDTGVPLTPFCGLRDELVFATCDRFEYEPGTDEVERHVRAVQMRSSALAVRRRSMLHGPNVAGDADTDGTVVAGKHENERDRGIAA